MSSQTNKELWRSWNELWNGNLSIADEIIAPNFVAHFAPVGNSPAEVRGSDGLKQWIGGWLAAFTGYSFTTTVGPLAEDDLVAGSFARRIKGGCKARYLPPLANRSSMWGWTSFASKAEKLSNTGCVGIRCNCCNKLG